MNIRHKLVASPLYIRFHAPYTYTQQRRMNILNLSNTKMQYRIEVEDEELFQVVPAKGKVAGYDTDELTVYMSWTACASKTCAVKVLYKAAPEEPDQSERTVDNSLEESPEDWASACCTQVTILVENCESEAVLHPSKEQYKPICSNCCLKLTDLQVLADKSSWKRVLYWPASIATLAVAAYFGCKLWGLNLFDLMTEKIF